MAIERDQVLHVATLAHLDLTDAEVDALTHDLGKILDHVAQLEELDTSSIAPTTHLAVPELPLLPDEAQEPLGAERATEQAPRVVEGGFAVPAFVDD